MVDSQLVRPAIEPCRISVPTHLVENLQKVDAAGWPASESPSCTWVLTILRVHKQLVIPISCMSLRRNSTCLKLIGHFSLFHQL